MRYVLGSRASIGGPLGIGRGGAAAWYLAGGVSAANCIAAYTPKGAASLAASYDNNAAPGNGLADGTYDAAPGTAPTFDTATGWTFNGSTQYLTTGITPLSGWTIVVRYSNAGSIDRYLFGAKGANFWGILPWYSVGTTVMYLAGGTTDAARKAPSLTSGVLAIAGTKAYRDGVDESLTLTNADAPTTLFLGGANSGGSLQNAFNGKIQAIAIYNTTLTAPQVAAISSAMSAL